MSTEVLRRAAALMRERAEAARDVTGASDWHVQLDWIDNGASAYSCYSVRSSGGRVSSDSTEEEAEHIASWHPAVALAVADWLDAESQAHTHIPGSAEPKSIYDMPVMRHSPAVLVARTYLGESAP